MASYKAYSLEHFVKALGLTFAILNTQILYLSDIEIISTPIKCLIFFNIFFGWFLFYGPD